MYIYTVRCVTVLRSEDSKHKTVRSRRRENARKWQTDREEKTQSTFASTRSDLHKMLVYGYKNRFFNLTTRKTMAKQEFRETTSARTGVSFPPPPSRACSRHYHYYAILKKDTKKWGKRKKRGSRQVDLNSETPFILLLFSFSLLRVCFCNG